MTPEEVRELWELCGLKEIHGGWAFPYSGGQPIMPSLDGIEALGYLFRWAVPLLKRWEMGNYSKATYAIVTCKGQYLPFEEHSIYPQEALAQACLKALRKAK